MTRKKAEEDNDDGFGDIELRTNSRVGQNKRNSNKDTEPGFKIDDEGSPSVQLEDKQWKKASNKDSKEGEGNMSKDPSTYDKNFGKMVKNSGAEEESWVQAYENDPKLKYGQTTEMRTKKQDRPIVEEQQTSNEMGTMDAKL